MVTRPIDLKSRRSKIVSRASFVCHSKPYRAKVLDNSSFVICLSGKSFMKFSNASFTVLNFSSIARRNSSIAPRAPIGVTTVVFKRGESGLRMDAGCDGLVLKLGALADSFMGFGGGASEARLPSWKAMDWRRPCLLALPTSSFLLLLGKMRFNTSPTKASVASGCTSSAFFFSRRRRCAFSRARAFSASVAPPKLSLNRACW
mmetsp:Transcript_117940/g.279957  ORF Transcript_117940/g.279957 Transcript_117940/m.279957 type:complete len:203 (+) Transcript_117940:1884-2492(+)